MSTKKVNGTLIGDHEVIGSVDNVWIDTSNPNKILTKVFVNGAWKTIADSAAASEAIAAVEAELTNKTNKVSEATEGNLAALDSSGDLTDSGKSTSDFMSAATNTGSDGQILEFTSSGPQWANAPEGTVVVDSAMSDVSENPVQNKVIKAYVDNFIPPVATDLEAWAESDSLNTSTVWDESIRTTAGSAPIVTEGGGKLVSIVPKADFSCAKLVTSGYNQLRLATNGGTAVAITDGYYFPVPKLTFGTYGSAEENNGILFTNSDGENMNPTVYFKPLASGVPTSITDGTQLTAQTSVATANESGGIYTSNGYKFYLTSGPGYLIVSGITLATTCAHFAWENWYNKFVAPDAQGDSGDSVNLTSLFSSAPNGSGKLLVLGTGTSALTTKAEWISATQVKITDPIARVTSPSWTNTPDDAQNPTEYTHTLTISGMKSGGKAVIEGQTQALTVEGTTVSYVDENATALSGAVRYEKSSPATATVNIAPDYDLNDCGIEMLTDVVGSAYIETTYACNIADWLAEFAKHNDLENNKVISEALATLDSEDKSLRELLLGAYKLGLKAAKVDAIDYMCMSVPTILCGSTTGAPSAANIPTNWDAKTMGYWTGAPRFVGQRYVTSDNVWYTTKATLSNATSDWQLE